MSIPIRHYISAFQQLFFPHICCGCGADYIKANQFICASCMHVLPATHFMDKNGNPIDKIFEGRIPVTAAGAGFYFYKSGLVQHLIAQLKYHQNKEAGKFLGRCLGRFLKDSNRFNGVDLLMPLPLHPKKEFQRGYNQAALICEGIKEVWPKPVCTKAVSRLIYTQTQTQGNRISRWKNMENAFWVVDPHFIKNKHILLIDDVITTGASLEACGNTILSVPGTKLSIATVAFTV